MSECIDQDWILKAVSRDENRVNITRPWVQSGWLIGTDGHRLHMVQTSEADGWFDMAMNRVSEGFTNELTPPGIFTGLIPTVSDWKAVYRVDFVENDRPDIKGKSIVVDGREINKRYIMDTFFGEDSMEVGYNPQDQPAEWSDPLFLRSHDKKRQALLMSLRKFSQKEWKKIQGDRKRRASNTWREDVIICPYCGYDDFETFKCEDNDWIRLTCDDCGKEFDCEVELEIRYTTRKIKETE